MDSRENRAIRKVEVRYEFQFILDGPPHDDDGRLEVQKVPPPMLCRLLKKPLAIKLNQVFG